MEREISSFRTMLNLPSGEKIYFDFEADFAEQNMRCIPMIVRFKMDAAGIKLQLADWCKFTWDERLQLALMPINSIKDLLLYNQYLSGLVKAHTGKTATPLVTNLKPEWADCSKIPAVLIEKTAEFNLNFPVKNWARLAELKRFALVKLCTSDHENKNLPKALIEFGLMQKTPAS